MKHLFVVGARPARHSLTPFVWNALFKKLKLSAVYTAQSVITTEDLANLLEEARGDETLAGFNVTMPWKEEVARKVDAVFGTAAQIKSVNTVKRTADGKLHGFNTDGWGAVEALKNSGVKMKGANAVVAGAGGASKSIVFELAKAGAQVTVLNRTESRAFELANDVSASLELVVKAGGLDSLDEHLKNARVFFNTTSLGAPGELSGVSILSQSQVRLTPSDCVFMDVVYRPKKTALLKLAHDEGRPIVFGGEMLIMQAVKAFEHFFDKKLPPKAVPLMRSALDDAISTREKTEAN